MNAVTKFILMAILISCFLPAFGQTIESTAVKSSKSSGSEKKAGDVVVKAGMIHIEIDGGGNTIFYLPANNPVAIVFNAATNAYEVKAPRDVATGQSSGKRLHGTVRIIKSNAGVSKGIPDAGITLLFDGNGDCDLSKLGLSGVMDVCYRWTPVVPASDQACFTITMDGQGMVARYDVKKNNRR
jgi:hypothetical protein